ncbi:MAG: SMP-30/gluconolactonase/LRE family protein [Rhodospirillales bacterium]|nr:SMP-30/gluconolactonase/LRE family protein [Rhodospirillales bacterium]MBN8907510.1 SMP-30/gluconolactonase/LRE family protein [Rhodospirillales bacterium]
MSAPQTLLDGLTFAEGPRWRDGRLWFSDFYSQRVIALGLDGAAETVLRVPENPSGLGWLPDGTLLVVSMNDRRLMRWRDGALTLHADLSAIAGGPCNDMLVDTAGRAYVGNFGYERFAGEGPRAARLARVDPDGSVTVAADDLLFPNGTVLTPDGRTLIIGETMGNRLTAFTVQADGGLTDRRTWAAVSDLFPDGICLDADGAIWVADPRGNRVVRVREGGTITDTIPLPGRNAYACMLGGEDRRTLFICTAPGSGPERAGKTDGKIETVRVAVPGAGLP